ncbi:uncharacterized protein N0V89_001091 [Didymosphaeria variabile]|uniref:Calcineurin-like phosphoesterase domain-containing protein n=1 Tax=Didymosphaeria variabile TaxID=1932322 RepID=A0A9W8XWD0_9PLEO|nr:uncharacterized protein N0V89_001091 [Didymosphaeria variabile]KAJ4360526.1 hypothetical protein N0V89_001091 [Didymosphaeria variabile]
MSSSTNSSNTHLLPRSNIFRPAQPTTLQRFRNPIVFFATWLYTHQPSLSPPSPPFPPSGKLKRRDSSIAHPLRVVCISDTHNTTPTVPRGDILVHAGDLSQNGTFEEVQRAVDWISSLPHEHKLVIAGNHDLILDDVFVADAPNRVFTTEDGRRKEDLKWGDVIYLEDSMATINVRDRNITVFGSPYTPKYGNWAFQYDPAKGGKPVAR